MRLLLPMVSFGPTIFLQRFANTLGWAHWHIQLLLPMVSLGPVIFLTGIADGLVWAHWHMRLLLPMVSCGPIVICTFCCQWFRLGQLTYAPAAADIFAWANYLCMMFH
jgi:hypothetical protein